MKTSRMALAAALGAACLPASAMANEDVTVSFAVPIEVQYDNIYKSTDPNAEGSDLYATIEPELVIGLPQGFSIQAGVTFEPLRDRDPREHRTLKSHGAYVNTLQLVWESDPVTLNAGKFTPSFAFAEAPGMYGDTFMETYELVERVGFGGTVALPIDGVADIAVTASLFTRDRTVLGEAAFTSRERLEFADGTVGNTEGLENGALTVDISPAAVPGLLVRGSYLHQGKGMGDAADQDAWGVGATYEVEVTEGVVVSPMADWVHSSDTIGFTDGVSTPGARTDTVTAGVQVAVGPYFGTLTHGMRTIKNPTAATQNDRFTQVSAGYAFDFGLGLEAGWVRAKEAGETSSTVGIVATYGLEF